MNQFYPIQTDFHLFKPIAVQIYRLEAILANFWVKSEEEEEEEQLIHF